MCPHSETTGQVFILLGDLEASAHRQDHSKQLLRMIWDMKAVRENKTAWLSAFSVLHVSLSQHLQYHACLSCQLTVTYHLRLSLSIYMNQPCCSLYTWQVMSTIYEQCDKLAGRWASTRLEFFVLTDLAWNHFKETLMWWQVHEYPVSSLGVMSDWPKPNDPILTFYSIINTENLCLIWSIFEGQLKSTDISWLALTHSFSISSEQKDCSQNKESCKVGGYLNTIFKQICDSSMAVSCLASHITIGHRSGICFLVLSYHMQQHAVQHRV